MSAARPGDRRRASAGRRRSSASRRTPRRARQWCWRRRATRRSTTSAASIAALTTLRYDAPGDPALAARMTALLRAAGIAGASRSTKAASTTAPGPRCATSIPTRDIPIVPLRLRARAIRRRSQFALGARSLARSPTGVRRSAAAASPTTCGACSAGGLACVPTRRGRRSRERGVPPLDRRTRDGARLGRPVRLPQPGAARGRHASDRRRICCPGTWPPAPADATRRRCASTPARPWAASAWMPTLSGRRLRCWRVRFTSARRSPPERARPGVRPSGARRAVRAAIARAAAQRRSAAAPILSAPSSTTLPAGRCGFDAQQVALHGRRRRPSAAGR